MNLFFQRVKTALFAVGVKNERIAEHIERLEIARSANLKHSSSAGVKIATVSYTVRQYKDAFDFISSVNEVVTEAVQEGAQLVCFPELMGLSPFLAVSGMGGTIAAVEDLPTEEEQFEAVSELFSFMLPICNRLYINTFSGLAKAHGVIISAGSSYVTERGGLVNRTYIFGENGEVIGSQDKLRLSATERKFGIMRGEKLTPCDTSIGRVGILSAEDCGDYMPFRALKESAVTVAIVGGTPFGGDVSQAKYRANQIGICAVVAGLASKVDELPLRACPPVMYAPINTTRSVDGILGESAVGTVLTGRVDINRVTAQTDPYFADKLMGL